MPAHSCRTRTQLAVLALALTAVCPRTFAEAPAPAAPPPLPSWDLTELYATPQSWDDSLARTRRQSDELPKYQGTLNKSAASMLAALVAVSDVRREAYRLDVYATLKSDEDQRIAINQQRKQQAEDLRTQLGRQTAWLAPELLRIGAGKVRAFRAENRTLDQRFGFFLDDTLRKAPHTLGPEAESVLAAAGTLLQQPSDMHDVLGNAEFPVPTVVLADGTSVRLDEPAYERYRQAANRADRKKVFDAYWGTWKKVEGTAGGMLTTGVMGNHFVDQSRRFSTSLQAALSGDNLPEAVYLTLIAETHAALPTFHRYLRLRQRLLGITDELRYYDNYPPMLTVAHPPRFSVEESERLTLDALQPLGEEYLGLLRHGFAARWMNAYPHEGKASGAYMNPLAYDVHPYVLLNHNDDYGSLSTVAHEWGHAVHTLLANRAQPFDKANYSIFIAETASIGNEMLLNDYMVEHAANREEKLFYLGEGLESIRTTYFRQVLFAEFELALYRELEAGRALSGEHMSEMYCTLLRQYYGEAQGVMKIDPTYCVEWAFVPHFYYDFYVFKYATSMAGAAFLTDAILNEGAPARERFLTMLRAGGSDYPYEIYRRAGIDMVTPGPYRALAARMDRLLDEFEALVGQQH